MKLGAKVILCGPPTLVPRGFEALGCEVAHHLDEILPRCDVVNALRIQKERQERGLFPSLNEYFHFYGITQERLNRAKCLLSATNQPLTEIARDVGCANAEHLGHIFRQHLGVSPSAWRRLNGACP